MKKRTYAGVLAALILSTAAPAVSPALPAMAANTASGKITQSTAVTVLAKDAETFVKKGSSTYCLTADGEQKSGWVKKSGKWYYFDKKDGKMVTGWLQLNDRKFFLKADGSMIEGPCWYNIGGKRYYFTKNGHVRSAWEMVRGKWYYRNTDGELLKNKWVRYNGKYYYLKADGAMQIGTVTIQGRRYTFGADGVLKGAAPANAYASARKTEIVNETIVRMSDLKDEETKASTTTDSGKTATSTNTGKTTTTSTSSGSGKTTTTSTSSGSDSGKTTTTTGSSKTTTTSTSSGSSKTTTPSTSTNKTSSTGSEKTTAPTATKKDTNTITKVTGKLNDLPESKRKFVIQIANYVRKYAPKYGIKVYSPIIAQAIHESGWGQSSLSAKYHNYFGLKCGTLWTGKSVNLSTKEEYSAGTLTTIRSNFRVYDNMEQGVKGYFEFIQLPRYSNLKGVTSPRQYLTNIKNDGYATGYLYVDHTMALVDMYDLTQFDK